MANNSTAAQLQELNDLRNRVGWLDEERRKVNRRLTELEQRLTVQEREIQGREQRIQDLERQLSSASAQLARLPQLDTQLAQFKDEIVLMIEQYDQRRIQSEKEMDRLRRIEQEVTARELTDIRKELPIIPRLQNEMELRVTEETRLANLIGVQQNKLSSLDNIIENREHAISFLEEKEKQNGRNITDIQIAIREINKRWGGVHDRLNMLGSSVSKAEANNQVIIEAQTEIRESTKNWMEQIQIGEYERNQRIENWRRVLNEQQDALDRFSKEWVSFSDQYKEAKMAVQTLSGWQKQLEQQQQEASELLRMDSHRMQAQWDEFKLDTETQRKTFAVESEQRWATINRHEKQVQEQLMTLEELLTKLQREKDLLQRIQNAQTDAIKRLPLMWTEEVEKAIAQNPHRRRQPALVPVREE